MEVLPISTCVDPQADLAAVVVSGPAAPAAIGAEQATALGSPVDTATQANDEWSEKFSHSLQAQHGRVREFLDRQRDRWKRVEAGLRRRIEELTGEIESLRSATSQLQQSVDERPSRADEKSDESSDSAAMSRRYEMALEDIRELKARNAELQKQLSQPRTGQSPAAKPATGGCLNWEAEKRRILAALESDSGSESPRSQSDRQEIEEIVRRTDCLLAEKNREIEELQNLLKHQSDNFGSVAMGAAAIEQLLDQDAIVREERENLKRLQVEAREKLRQAEVTLSLERAKMARQQAEIEEKVRLMELRSHASEEPAEALCPTGKPVRGRWLARLGLSDVEEPGRRKREDP